MLWTKRPSFGNEYCCSSQEPPSNNRPSKTDATEKTLPIEFLEDKTDSQLAPFPNEFPAVLQIPETSSNETPKQTITKCHLGTDVKGNSAVVDPKTPPTRHEPAPIFETASNGDLEDPNTLSQPVSASGVEVSEDTDRSSKSLSEEILPPKESILTAEGGSEERKTDPQKRITRECSLVLHRLVLFPNERRKDKWNDGTGQESGKYWYDDLIYSAEQQQAMLGWRTISFFVFERSHCLKVQHIQNISVKNIEASLCPDFFCLYGGVLKSEL